MPLDERIEKARQKTRTLRLKAERRRLLTIQKFVAYCPAPNTDEVAKKYKDWHDSVSQQIERIAA